MIRSPAIAAIIAGLIALDEELARSEGPGDVYRSDGPLPPRTSRVTFNRTCRAGIVAGAERIAGRGAGTWTCGREAWHAARRKPRSPALPLEATESDLELARGDLLAAGFRFTKVTDEEWARQMLRDAGFRFTKARRTK